jgi:CBS domain-containing protein
MLHIKDVMSRPALTVHPETPLKDVARLLVEQRISGLPVTDDQGRVVGVISEADLLQKEQGAANISHRHFAWLLGETEETRSQLAKLAATTAGDAMTAPAVTIGGDRPLTEAAALMTSRKVNRLPVVDGDVLVGVVSRADLIRAYVRSDDELGAVIRDEVLHDTMWLNPRLFDVSVANGVVRIGGSVGRRSTAEVIARIAALVPGVVAVTSELHWDVDDREIVVPDKDLVSPYGDPR